MRAGTLDCRVQFERYTGRHDGYQVVEEWGLHGPRRWASRRDISDAERLAAGWIEATLASRFVVRSSAFTRDLNAKDRLICEGLTFDIVGIKEIGRRDRLEITAVARADLR